MGTWWASWTSNPWCGANNVVGRFDSDAPPPFHFIEELPFLFSRNPDLPTLQIVVRDFLDELRSLKGNVMPIKDVLNFSWK